MGRLEDVRSFLEERLRVVQDTERRLDRLLQKYETFFSEVNGAREHELDQLVEATLDRLPRLPGWYREAVEAARPEVEKELAHERSKLKRRRASRRKKAEALRQESVEAEQALAAESREWDAKEAELEARIEAVNQELVAVKRRIRELSRGLGFLTNFFKARPLGRRFTELQRERRTLTRTLELLRKEWHARLAQEAEAEAARRRQWVELETETTAMDARIEALEMERPRIVARSTVERVLGEREPDLREPVPGDPLCPRCRMPNPPEAAFCRICARRLLEDRTDFAGSLEEIVELNRHHRRFAEGMRACQETLGLVRGIASGLEALLKSVNSMIDTRKKHRLKRLSLEIPSESVEYGRLFDEMREVAASDLRLHPLVFARRMAAATEGKVSEEQLRAYFERIGRELSRAAGQRWH